MEGESLLVSGPAGFVTTFEITPVGAISEGSYTLTVLLDTDTSVTDNYGVRGVLYAIIVDQEGKVHSVHIGSDSLSQSSFQAW